MSIYEYSDLLLNCERFNPMTKQEAVDLYVAATLLNLAKPRILARMGNETKVLIKEIEIYLHWSGSYSCYFNMEHVYSTVRSGGWTSSNGVTIMIFENKIPALIAPLIDRLANAGTRIKIPELLIDVKNQECFDIIKDILTWDLGSMNFIDTMGFETTDYSPYLALANEILGGNENE